VIAMSVEPVTIGDDEIDPLADPISPMQMQPNQGGVQIGLKTTSVKRLAGVMTNNDDSSVTRESILPLYHGISQLDQNSTEGKFTWISVNNKGYLPEVIRFDQCGKIEKYVSVKMAEKGFLGQFMKNLPYEVMAKVANISSHKVTEAEAILLNEINARHCDNGFGRNESFVRDLLVKSDEFVNFYSFLNLCSDKMVLKKSQVGKDKCGFLRIAGSSDVPYVLIEDRKYLPLFYFEGEGIFGQEGDSLLGLGVFKILLQNSRCQGRIDAQGFLSRHCIKGAANLFPFRHNLHGILAIEGFFEQNFQ